MSVTRRVAGLPLRPGLDELAERVGNEEWLAALALLRLSPAVAGDAAQWASWDEHAGRYTTDDIDHIDHIDHTDHTDHTDDPDDPDGPDGDAGLPADLQVRTFHPDARMDWGGWVADVDTVGRGWSSSEQRLFALVAALVVDGRTVALAGVLDQLGSWEAGALDVLVQWASGGNNREHPGRLRVTPSTSTSHNAGAGAGAGAGNGEGEGDADGGRFRAGRG